MAKMVTHSDDQVKDKCMEKANDKEDQISILQDEILILILSRLTMKEGARTSVLSRRWEHLWQFVYSWDFDGSDMLEKKRINKRLLTEERFRFVGWVNKVLELNLNKDSRIDNFRVRFDLNQQARRYIDKWIHFALTKNVKILEFDLTPTNFSRKNYDFSQWLTNIKKCPLYVPWTKSISSLCLKYINITGEFVEYLISICPLLERLSIVSSETLLSLKIIGSSLKLTYLNISSCVYLLSTEINAPNLVSLQYLGKASTLRIVSAPQLIDVYVCSYSECPITSAIGAISSYFTQIETLTLGIDLLKKSYQFQPLPILPNLKYLKWIVYACDNVTFLGLMSLIEAAPFLQRFKLELNWTGPREPREPKLKHRNFSNEHLKVVEMIGFVGIEIDIELVWFFLQIATKLEKLNITPCCSGKVYGCGPRGWIGTRQERAAKIVAEKLRFELPTGANFLDACGRLCLLRKLSCMR